MTEIPYQKWRDPIVLFLDDGFDCDEAYQHLFSAGYLIERFSLWFPRPLGGGREEGIQDPEIIKLCDRHCWVLVTADKNIINVHRREVEQAANLGILATAHNTVQTILPWVESLVKLKSKIEQNSFKKKPRPWYGRFDQSGKFSVPISTVRPIGTSPSQKS